ncbi:ribonuclease H-like domain-containing protein [Candidatus Woesearchaeota archaeon]|nr:ribonuclease H-like domain-containing protein [Candidatus Woesearchaeota archaeon]
MKQKFYIIELTYKIENNKAVIIIYGRTQTGESIILKDRNFEPYFYVLSADERIEHIAKENHKVVKTETITKKLIEKQVTATKVFVNLPSAVPELREEAKKYGQTLEDDILFVRRYLIDKEITPLTLLEAETENNEIISIKKADEEPIKPKTIAIDIETYTPQGSFEISYENPIITIALHGDNFQKLLTWKKTNIQQAETLTTEKEMLEKLAQLIKQYQPDFIIGYNSDSFDMPYIIARAKKLKAKINIGKDNTDPEITGKTHKECKITGISHIDILRFVRRVLGMTMKTDSFTLEAVASELLGEHKHDFPYEQIGPAWDSGNIKELAEYNLHDAKLTYKIFEKAWPALLEFTKIVGLTPFDISRLSFSQFVEWFMARKAFQQNELLPNKPTYKEQTKRMNFQAKGALVFEPKQGVYKDIIVFDYRSLYPSIIASANISPGTLNCECCNEKVPELNIHFCKKKNGFISTIIKEIISYRTSIKKQLKTNNDPLLEARVYALKVLLNSFYGYMGFAAARWYSAESVEATTSYARHYISQVKDKATKSGFKVIYGDTDSVFITLEEKTTSDANKLLEQINKELPKPMELEMEGHYLSGIFVSTKGTTTGAKKRYALLKENGELKIRGFETIRRNTAIIAKKTQEQLIRIVLQEGNSQKAISLIKETIKKLRKNEVAVKDVIITTQIQKETSKYDSVGPHVAAAKLLENKGIKISKGMIISYIIGRGTGRIRDRVILPKEAKQTDYDGEYYITNSLLPAVENILNAIGINLSDVINEGQKGLGEY